MSMEGEEESDPDGVESRVTTGRVVPLNRRALDTLKLWAQQFPNRQPEDYVFPSEKCGGAGQEDSFGFTAGATIYDSDPTTPVGDIKEAWEAARKKTRRHCPQCKTGILADTFKSGEGIRVYRVPL